MNTIRKLFALILTVVGLTGVAWAGGHPESSFYDNYFNQEELTNQF